MDKLEWLPIGFVGLIIIMVLTNRISTIRLRKNLAKAWEGKPFFIKIYDSKILWLTGI